MKQNKMQIPEGYKNSSLGIIPNDWEVKRLGEVCSTFKSGISITSKSINKQGLYPVYGGNGLRGYTDLFTHDGEYVLIGRQGALCGNITYCIGKQYISEHAIAVQVDNNHNDIKFFNYKLLFWNLNRFSESSAQPGLSVEKLVRYKLVLPPLPQQQKIAEILGTWDEAIEKQSKLIDKLTDRKRGLMQQLLTGKKRLAGFSEEWKEVRLGEIGERVVRKNTEKNHNVVTISAQQGFVSQKDYFNKTIASEVTDNYYLIHKDEFCYNKSYSAGYPMGAIKRLKTFDKAVVTTLYICFKLKENISKDFFEQFTEGGNLINSLVKVANEGGRAHGLLNVTPVDFFNIKFTLPSLSEQTAIANILTAADKEIELAKSKLELLRSQKNGLMQELLTGKTRVKIDSHKI